VKKSEAVRLIDVLSEAASRLEIKVRTERLKGVGGIPVSGGLARVDEEWVVFLERRQPPRERLAVLAEALAGFDFNGFDLPPEAEACLRSGQRPGEEAAVKNDLGS